MRGCEDGSVARSGIHRDLTCHDHIIAIAVSEDLFARPF